jgi:hypothetical protein
VRRAAQEQVLEQVLELEQAPALALHAAAVAERQRAPAWPGRVLTAAGLPAVREQPVAPWPVEQAAALEWQAQAHPAGLAEPERHLPEQQAAVSD